jgi:hypothetical protein
VAVVVEIDGLAGTTFTVTNTGVLVAETHVPILDSA